MAIVLSEIVGGNYNDFWHCKSFFRMVKGSKGSKKSKTAALWYIYYMMKFPDANTLVIRKVFGTMKDSVFADLLWAIDKLEVSQYWKASISPLEMTYLPTKQKILFRGMDDVSKLASVSVRRGYLCWVWIEEFFEIVSEEDFNKLQYSIRGKIPAETGLFKQITGTFNPWSAHSWIKARFFDNPGKNTFCKTSTYKDNEFLGDDDIARYEELYELNPRLARIICDGDWGITEGLIYDKWVEKDFDYRDILKTPGIKASFGLDFGYKVSYNAFIAILIDMDSRTLWIYDEMYEKGLTNIDIARRITSMGYSKEVIYADSAEPKSIFELQTGFLEEVRSISGDRDFINWSLPNIRPAMKGGDSVMNGIQRVQSFQIYVHPRCVNTIMELNNYAYDQDKFGNYLERPMKEFDHCLVGDTLVLTEKGPMCIKDIVEGDMVMTHLGYREVLAAGITRPEPAEIWRITYDDGTILEGTADHPIVTTMGLVPLGRLSVGDTLIKWVKKAKCRDISGIDTSVLPVGCFTRAFLSRGVVDGSYVAEPDAESRCAFVYASRQSGTRNEMVAQIESVEQTDRREFVYDLTVDEAHDFFANGILVLNCMDAMRYAMEKVFIRSHGCVVEAKGIDGEQPRVKRKCKRVASV